MDDDDADDDADVDDDVDDDMDNDDNGKDKMFVSTSMHVNANDLDELDNTIKKEEDNYKELKELQRQFDADDDDDEIKEDKKSVRNAKKMKKEDKLSAKHIDTEFAKSEKNNHGEGATLDLEAESEGFKDELLKLFRERLTPGQRRELAGTLQLVLKMLRRTNMPTMLYGRSLLGYYRHQKSMIPWDDQAEIAVILSSTSTIGDVDALFTTLKKAVKGSQWSIELSDEDKNTLIFSGATSGKGDWKPVVRINVLTIKEAKSHKPILDFELKEPKDKMQVILSGSDNSNKVIQDQFSCLL